MLLLAESSTPLLNVFWWMLWFFMFMIWIWLLISIFGDIFRSDMSGGVKALWVFFVIILPMLGVLVYLIANGSKMQERAMRQATDMKAAQDNYIKSVAGSGGGTADELEKLSNLHGKGVLTDEEFAAQKAKLLG